MRPVLRVACSQPWIYLEDAGGVLLSGTGAPAASALEDRRHALAARRADGDQCPAGALLGKKLRSDVEDPAAGGGEGVSGGQRGALHVQPGPVDLSQHGVEAEALLAVHR